MQENRYCHQCGAVNRITAKFCLKCGVQMRALPLASGEILPVVTYWTEVEGTIGVPKADVYSYMDRGGGSYHEAWESGETSHQVNPDRVIAYCNKANSLYHLKRYIEAIEAVEQALQLDSTCSAAFKEKAWALVEMGRNTEALQACDKAIQYDPKNAEAHRAACHALVNLNNLQQALRAADLAIQADPSLASAWVDKSWVLGKMGRHVEAIEANAQALRLSQ